MVPSDSDLLQPQAGEPLQAALRHRIVGAIVQGMLSPGQRMPSSRLLAAQLRIARNTVVAVYDELAERGILEASPRRGLFVAAQPALLCGDLAESTTTDLMRRLNVRPSMQRNIVKPTDWQSFPYPFVYGQVDPLLFPLADWRACSRLALGRASVNWWAADHATADDPMLIEQIRRHVLPARGLHVRPEQVLITIGSQHGIHLLLRLFGGPGRVVGIEDPGYPDARNMAEMDGATVRLLPVDDQGVEVGAALANVDLAIVTPAHHCPTMVVMPIERRHALLRRAERDDAILVEDDYEAASDTSDALPAIAAMDRQGRVLYLGSFSKVLAPGMRLGFMVGPAPVIAEARALRRLMHRSVPLNNQRTAAVFMAEGHYGRLRRRLAESLTEKRLVVRLALSRHLPGFTQGPETTGSAIWLRCPDGMGGAALALAARAQGVVIEIGEPFFADPRDGRPYIRLGLASIATDAIFPGIMALARAAANLDP